MEPQAKRFRTLGRAANGKLARQRGQFPGYLRWFVHRSQPLEDLIRRKRTAERHDSIVRHLLAALIAIQGSAHGILPTTGVRMRFAAETTLVTLATARMAADPTIGTKRM